MSDALRVGVLGTGRIGAMHAELVARRVPGTALACVHDAAADVAAAVAAALGVRAVSTPAELVESPDVDAVAVCSSTDTHVELLELAAAAGKPVFCEKPISLELADVDRALATVERAGVLLQVGFNRRFDPAHASVREAVASGRLGDVHLVRITSRDPSPPPLDYVRVSGGLFVDMTIHDFDMARYLTGSEVVEVFARGAVRITPELEEFGDVDTAVATLVHESGALTVIDNSRQAVYGYDQRVEVLGSQGVAASDNPLAHTGVSRTADGGRSAPLPTFFLDRYVPSYVREWTAFAEVVRVGGPTPVDGTDGRAALVLGLAAARSAHEGRPVRTAEIG